MFLHELFESDTKHITFCFGRMNPPTIGHEQVFKTMQFQGGEMKIFLSQSQDVKKNPLDYSTKIKFLKAMFPQYANDVIENAALNTVVKVASYLYEQGYNAATFVAGSDRLEDMEKLLTQYNGVEGKAHGYYKFDILDFVSSGNREDGAEGVSGISASGARAAAANNDLNAFKEATGAGELAKPLFDAVRKGMKISESVSEAGVDAYELVDVYIKGMHKGQTITKLIAKKFPNQKIPALIKKLTDKFGVNPNAVVYGPSKNVEDYENIDEGIKTQLAAAALAIANILGSPAQAADEHNKPITIAYVKIDNEIKKFNLGDKFTSVEEAEDFITKILQKQGLQGYEISIKRGFPKKHSEQNNKPTPTYIDKTPYTAKHNKTDYSDKSPYVAKPTNIDFSMPAN